MDSGHMSKTITRIEPPTTAEIEAIRDTFDRVLRSSTGKSHPVTATGEPLCEGSKGQPASYEEQRTTNCLMASFPPGYLDGHWCLYCIREWRENG